MSWYLASVVHGGCNFTSTWFTSAIPPNKLLNPDFRQAGGRFFILPYSFKSKYLKKLPPQVECLYCSPLHAGETYSLPV